jgi:hypothetical protein
MVFEKIMRPALQGRLSISEREALECGGLDAALQRLPPILMSKVNAIGIVGAHLIFKHHQSVQLFYTSLGGKNSC